MSTSEEVLLQKIAGTLDDILVELRRGADRHEAIDKSEADAEDMARRRNSW